MLETKSVDDNFSMLVTQHRKSMSKSLLTSMLTIKLVIFHVGDKIKMVRDTTEDTVRNKGKTLGLEIRVRDFVH